MAMKATVIYDFEGMKENGEISLMEGEVVTVLKTDVGDGWWEGVTPSGHKGLFPESYVNLAANENGNASSNHYNVNETVTDSWQGLSANGNYSYGGNTQYNSYGNNEDNDDNWSEDWDDGQSEATTIEPRTANRSSLMPCTDLDNRSLNSVDSRSVRVSGTVGKSFNRFSSFVKHGGEAFILGKADARVREVDRVHIDFGSDTTASWRTNNHKFTCSLENPLVKSKMKGFKSFVAYKLTPSDTDVCVERRYKHFDWLYDRMIQRYPMLVIPRLPEKQSSGRFEEEFIEYRMARLKIWIAYICRHPVLSTSSVFRNYITLTEQKAWKMAKRKAERDEFLGANFFLTIDIKNQPYTFDLRESEGRLEQFKKFAKVMDDGVAQLASTARDVAGKHGGVFRKEFVAMGRSFATLTLSFNQHQTPESQVLTDAMKHTSQTYEKIGEMFAEQPKNDITPLLHQLWLHKGILEVFPDSWHMQSGALRKVRECKKLQEEGRMPGGEVDAVEERVNRMSSVMQAEITHFHKERVINYKHMMTNFLKSQIEFYEGIAAELRLAMNRFEEVPDEN